MNRKQRRAAAKFVQPSPGARAAAPASVMFLQAVQLHQDGRLDEAERLYRDILESNPRHAGSLNHLGLIARAKGRIGEAVEYLRNAVAAEPNHVNALVNLGGVLRILGDFEEAISACRKAIMLRPDMTEAYTNLGNLLMDVKRPGEAVLAFQHAVDLSPDSSRAHLRLGVALAEAMQLEEASRAYETAVGLEPDSAHLHFHLGNALAELKRDAPATEAYKKAIKLDPDLASAYHNLASLLQRRNMISEALLVHRTLLDRQPHHATARFNYCHLKHHACDWRGLAEDEEGLLDADALFVPFTVMTMDSTPEQQLRFARRWAAKLGQEGTVPLWKRSAANEPRHGRLRVGYLSSDFHDHATVHLMAELIERHDRNRFEIAAYSYGRDDKSAARRRLLTAFDRFVELREVGDAVAARRIHADGVDILVDLKGYTLGSRTQILMWRPAPIQVNYLGYPGTLGGDFADYIVADSFIAPMSHQPFYSEKIVHLPDSYQPNDTTRMVEDVPSREACGLPPEGFVFCSFNNTYKITPPVFDVWMRLLNAVPGSVLWLLEANALVKDNLMREAAQRGVDPRRLIFAPKMVHARHLGRHRHADLFLDTLPVNAHTTASDALWMGLPVVTCAGDALIGRVAGSLLRAVGLPELITTSLEEYEALALRLASEPGLLSGVRDRLLAGREEAPLFDIDRYARYLEAAYERMWSIHEAGGSPEAFAVTPIKSRSMEHA